MLLVVLPISNNDSDKIFRLSVAALEGVVAVEGVVARFVEAADGFRLSVAAFEGVVEADDFKNFEADVPRVSFSWRYSWNNRNSSGVQIRTIPPSEIRFTWP
jgi:hypothetical protein